MAYVEKIDTISLISKYYIYIYIISICTSIHFQCYVVIAWIISYCVTLNTFCTIIVNTIVVNYLRVMKVSQKYLAEFHLHMLFSTMMRSRWLFISLRYISSLFSSTCHISHPLVDIRFSSFKPDIITPSKSEFCCLFYSLLYFIYYITTISWSKYHKQICINV